MRYLVLVFSLALSASALAASCRCGNGGGEYTPAPCPAVTDNPGIQGDGIEMWFNSIPAENVFGLLAAFARHRICLSSEVGGSVYIKTPGKRPWAEVTRTLAAQYGYRADIDDTYVYIYKP